MTGHEYQGENLPTVHELTIADITQVLPILREAWIENGENTEIVDNKFFRDNDSREWLSTFIDDGGKGLVATADDSTAGVLLYQIEQSPEYWKSDRHILVMDIAVDALYRRQGIATLLEEKVEELAKEGGISLIVGEVWEYNDASRVLMQKMGRVPIYTVWGKLL